MDTTIQYQPELAVSEEDRLEIYGTLNTVGQCLVNEGASPESFIAYALQVDPHSRWRCVAEKLFSPEELAKASEQGPFIFIYGNMSSDVFIEIFGDIDDEIESQVREDLDEGDIRTVIITHDAVWFADIELVPILN